MEGSKGRKEKKEGMGTMEGMKDDRKVGWKEGWKEESETEGSREERLNEWRKKGERE